MSSPDYSMLIDVVDRSNHTVGTASRKDVFSDHHNFRTVHVFLFNEDYSAMLLQLLPPNHRRNPGKFGSSVAGYLHAGESYKQAATRKVRSELGLFIGRDLHELAQFSMDDNSVTKFVGLYSGVANGAPVFDPFEIAACVYFPIQQLDFMIGASPEAFTPTFLHAYHQTRKLRPTLNFRP